MINKKLHYRKGSVILVSLGIISVLLILLCTFLKSTSKGTYSAKKLGDTMIARELANSLALLSNQYLKNIVLKDNGQNLRDTLSLPYDKMKTEEGKDITDDLKSAIRQNLTNDNSDDFWDLLINESGLNIVNKNDDIKISWKLFQKDFSSIWDKNNDVYPREKIGRIHIYVTINHVLPSQKNKTEEKYEFVSDVKVVANNLPVLSKFTLYVEDALDGDDNTRFNIVKTEGSGQIKPDSPHPWILNNGSSTNLKSYKDLVEDTRGFVYLGTGNQFQSILLGIDRGSEWFHFYAKQPYGKKTFVVLNPSKKAGVVMAEGGLCDTNDIFTQQLGNGYKRQASVNSIFRLYGANDSKSPTVVLGHVNSLFASIRWFTSGDRPQDSFLPYLDHKTDFYSALGIVDNQDDGYAFDSGIELLPLNNAHMEKYPNIKSPDGFLPYESYTAMYASKLDMRIYNNDLAYVATENTVDYPFKRGQISDGDLKKLCGIDGNDETNLATSSDKIFETVPSEGKAKYADIYGSNVDLKNIDNFIDAEKLYLNKNGKRIAYSVTLTSDSEKKDKLDDVVLTSDKNFIEYLKFKGILKENNLDFDGWMYLDNAEGIDFKLDFNKYKTITNGGIILSDGNISIKGNIESSNSSLFTIIALNGDINIESSATRIDASLISKTGQVIIEGDGNTNELNITGNIVMKKIPSGDLKGMKRGMNLNYNTSLSAQPYNKDANEKIRSEYPLLMIDLKNDVEMID